MNELSLLLKEIDSEIHESALYNQITQNRIKSIQFSPLSRRKPAIPKLLDCDSTHTEHRSYLKILNEQTSDNMLYSNIFTTNSCSKKDVLSSALTQDIDAFICQMIDGSIHAVPISSAHDRADIVAVLAIPAKDTLCIRWESEHEVMKSVGCFENCINLIYVAPFPEGVEDIAGMFTDCQKLNCPIYLPSTIKWAYELIQGCTNFNSEIYVHSAVTKDIGLKEYSSFLHSY